MCADPLFRNLLSSTLRLYALPSHPHFLFEPPGPIKDWVQDTATATAKWGDIGDWDVSGVQDFGRCFNTHRDAVGAFASNANPNAKKFVGTAISKWITISLTSMEFTFHGANSMNADLSGWRVGKVTTMQNTFAGAHKFVGTGLSAWDTASVITLRETFYAAGEMNSDLSGWDVAKVTNMQFAFYYGSATKFVGAGLGSWDTTSVTTLHATFKGAGEMNSDLSKWNVAKGT